MTQFSAPWSRFLKVTSAVITAIICGSFWLAAPTSSMSESVAFKVFLILLPVILLGASAVFIVLRYEITAENIEIVRVCGRTKYRLNNIKSIEFDPKATELSVRTFGNGGLYSISGFFRNERLGPYRAYVVNSANCIVIHRKEGSPIVISPDQPDQFLEEVNQLIST